jgi:hemerythrin
MHSSQWNSSLVLGLSQVDEDHERLVNLLNSCYRALMEHNPYNELAGIINELRDYSHYHFEAETNLMVSAGYPATYSHLTAHTEFTSSIQQFKERFQAGESFVALDILSFLNGWLVSHIQESDRDLANYLKEKGAV